MESERVSDIMGSSIKQIPFTLEYLYTK